MGVVVSGFLEVVAGVSGSAEGSVGGVSVSKEDKGITTAAGIVFLIVLATTSSCRGSGNPSVEGPLTLLIGSCPLLTFNYISILIH